MSAAGHAAQQIGLALRVIDDAWDIVSQGAFIAREMGRPIDRLVDISLAATEKRSETARHLLDRIAQIDTDALPGEIALTLAVARGRAEIWALEADWYWHVFDPMGVGFFALFAPTPYGGGFMLQQLEGVFRDFPLLSNGDFSRYLGLVSDYARLINQLCDRTMGQAQRGIYLPQVQLAQAVPLLENYRGTASAMLYFAPDKATSKPADFIASLGQRIETEVLPAFDRFIAELSSPAYAEQAPAAVGMTQYPRGDEIYAKLVTLHTTRDYSPADVHQRGLERMARVRRDMQALFDEIGFTGSPSDYLATIEANPAWRAGDVPALDAFFRKYIDRIAPHIERCFRFKPVAGHDVQALPPEVGGSMTFGYYAPPTTQQAQGLYRYNAVNLVNNALPNIASLNYHELVPGHHFHIATQRENAALHPLRQHSFVNAYNEGWAEYAATLAGELGMYQEPEERFGRLMMDAFLTCRLVVDTGMNALGWSLQQARDYMHEHSFMRAAEVNSESIRYSCDLPGQSLAYKLGDEALLALRAEMKARLGNRFDLRDFHDAVLGPGALPLPLLEATVLAQTDKRFTA